MADLFRGTADNNVNVTGHLLGGGTVSASCVADKQLRHLQRVWFDNLTSVDFAQSTMAGWPATGTGLSIDNIVFNAPTDGHVPEPASLALVGLAALGAGLACRRKLRPPLGPLGLQTKPGSARLFFAFARPQRRATTR